MVFLMLTGVRCCTPNDAPILSTSCATRSTALPFTPINRGVEGWSIEEALGVCNLKFVMYALHQLYSSFGRTTCAGP